MRATSGIYLAVLPNDQVSPLARESDEEKPAAIRARRTKKEPREAGRRRSRRTSPRRRRRKTSRRPRRTRRSASISRASSIASSICRSPPADLSNLQTGTAGQIYYLKTVDGKSSLNRYDLTTRKNETLLPDANDYVVSADGKKLLYRKRQRTGRSCRPRRRFEPAEGRIAVDAIEVRIDPRAEWKQIFDEAWRINRDYFYAPNMHGVDWATAARRSTRRSCPHVATRADLNRVLQWMSSELSVGHHNVGGGDTLDRGRRRCRAACSAPTTRSPTAAIG